MPLFGRWIGFLNLGKAVCSSMVLRRVCNWLKWALRIRSHDRHVVGSTFLFFLCVICGRLVSKIFFVGIVEWWYYICVWKLVTRGPHQNLWKSWFLIGVPCCFFNVFVRGRHIHVNWVVVSNIFYFHPYLGKIPILTIIFQMGWNHQLVKLYVFPIVRSESSSKVIESKVIHSLGDFRMLEITRNFHDKAGKTEQFILNFHDKAGKTEQFILNSPRYGFSFFPNFEKLREILYFPMVSPSSEPSRQTMKSMANSLEDLKVQLDQYLGCEIVGDGWHVCKLKGQQMGGSWCCFVLFFLLWLLIARRKQSHDRMIWLEWFISCIYIHTWYLLEEHNFIWWINKWSVIWQYVLER